MNKKKNSSNKKSCTRKVRIFVFKGQKSVSKTMYPRKLLAEVHSVKFEFAETRKRVR